MQKISEIWRKALFALLLATGGAGHASGQDAPASPPAAEPVSNAIPASEIPWRANADESFARDIAGLTNRKKKSAPLRDRLTDLSEKIHRLSLQQASIDLTTLPVVRLENMQRYWHFYKRQLDTWREDLKRMTSVYVDDSETLAKMRAQWEATRSNDLQIGITPALTLRVEEVLREIEHANGVLNAPLSELLELGSRANDLQISLARGSKAVDAAIEYQNRQLAVVDSPPLWELAGSRATPKTSLDSPAEGLAIERNFLEEFLSSRKPQLRLYLAVSLLLLPLLLWLSGRCRKAVSNDPELQSTAHVLVRPISTWLVLVLLGFVLIEADAPGSLRQLALLLPVIPVLRILPTKVFNVLGPWPYISSGLYVLNILAFLLADRPAAFRLYILTITLLGLAGLFWLILRSRTNDQAGIVSSGPVRSAFLAFCGIGAAALGVSAVSNIFGNVSLAVMLTDATLDSSYFALATYAVATVLSIFVKLALSRREKSRLQIVSQHTGPLLQSLGTLIKAAAFMIWLVFALNEFRVYRPIADGLRKILTHEISVGQISITLGSIVVFGLAVFLAFWVARTIRHVLADEVLPKMRLPQGVGNSISTLTYYLFITLGLLIALAIAGFHVGQLAIVFGALGVGIGFGLQNIVNNFVSGLILMFERPIRPGDVVEIAGVYGKVSDIGMRATTVVTFEGAEVLVPNGMLLSDKLVNWTLSNMNRRLEVKVGVAYGTDPASVVELLARTAGDTPGVLKEPEPYALFTEFGASSLDFTVRAWSDNLQEWLKIHSDLTVRINNAIKEAGMEIPFPQHDLHLRSLSPDVSAQMTYTRRPAET
jgi:potassium efflux system protein